VGESIGARGSGEETHLQEVHAIGLHAIHPFTHSLFDGLTGDFHGPKDAPFGRADDSDRGLEVLYGSALGGR
jgi:hypothetical protein